MRSWDTEWKPVASDEETGTAPGPTVGDRLREARLKKKLSLEDIAAQTRVPLRHLESLESSDWTNLPAATYSVGFAKSYAGAVDLDRAEIGELLRAEMGGTRPPVTAPAEVFEPADPARAMPKWLVIGAIVAVLLVVGVMSWLNNRALDSDEPQANVAAVATAPAIPAPAPPQAAPAAQGPVVLSAAQPLWMQVKEKGGETYFAGILKPGKDFTVPATAAAPILGTARPDLLKISIGGVQMPAVAAPGQSVTEVSLLPADLLKGGATPSPAATASPAPNPGQ